MEKNILKRSKYLVVSLVLTCAFTTCNSAQHKAIAADCDCKKIKLNIPDRYPFEFDSIANVSYPIKLTPTKDSTVLGIWFESYAYIYIKIYYSKNYKLYCRKIFISTFGAGEIPDYSFHDDFTNEIVVANRNNKNILIEKRLYDKKIFNDNYDYISKKDSTLITISSDNRISFIFRKVDSITQPLAERNEYVSFCQITDSNTIGWFPGGGIMSRPYKKEGNYYIMMMSSGGWECHPVDATILSNGDMRLDSGPFGSYYVITKDTSEFRTYSANDKLIDSDKRQLNYNYMDYPAYYLFHTVYGYNGKFIPLPPK